MNKEEVKQLFEDQAQSYDDQWSNLSVLKDAMHHLMKSYLRSVPDNAHVLCVGVGTGQELLYLARHFPNWRFTAVEPATNMLEICKNQVAEHGFLSRCTFHNGFLESLKTPQKFDAATCILVSHFLMEEQDRIELFAQIASLLNHNGVLINADLMADTEANTYPSMLELWLGTISDAGASEEKLESIKEAYKKDVSLLPVNQVKNLMRAAGFNKIFPFFQSGLICAMLAESALARS